MGERKLGGRVAVVTGASRLSGIGAAICRGLAREGADVFFTSWREYDAAAHGEGHAQDPERLREKLRAMGVRCEFAEVDLSQPDAARRVLDEAERRVGPPRAR